LEIGWIVIIKAGIRKIVIALIPAVRKGSAVNASVTTVP